MAFVPRSRDVIRANTLAYIQARFAALGTSVDTSAGSFLYLLCDALAVEDEGIEATAAGLTQAILVNTAAGSILDRHGAVYNVPRNAAAAAQEYIQVSGAVSTLYTIPAGSVLTSPDGLVYTPVSAIGGSIVGGLVQGTTDSSGNLTLTATCGTPGAAGNKLANTVFTWNVAPTGMNPTGVAIAVGTTPPVVTPVPGVDAESDTAYQARLLSRIQNRPASGNRSDWVAWATAVSGVVNAFVYPIGVGEVTVVIIGPVAEGPTGNLDGDNVANSRFVSGALARIVGGYIEGTNDANGIATPTGTQLRPVTMTPTTGSGAGNYIIEIPAQQLVNVEIRATMDVAHPYPWTGTFPITASTATSITVTGNATALAGLPALIPMATSPRLIRGDYQQVTLPAASGFSYAGGSTVITFAAAVLLGSAVLGTMYPAPPNWAALRLAVFKLFDGLGPGDTSPATRWPVPSSTDGPTLYVAALIATIQGVAGVLTNSVVAPATDTNPFTITLGNMLDVGTFIVHA